MLAWLAREVLTLQGFFAEAEDERLLPLEREVRVKSTTDQSRRDDRKALMELGREQLAAMNLIVASNRGPVEFRREPDGRISYRRGQGGLVTALSSLVEVLESTWISAPLSPIDAEVGERFADRLRIPMGAHPMQLAFVKPDPACFHGYYDILANSLLWFVQHGISQPYELDFDEGVWQAWESYREVNRQFARAIAAVAARSSKMPLVLIQDYHLYLVPLFLRTMLPKAFLHHFTHIAWPGPEAWFHFPPAVREELLKSLLCCDLVGFHTPHYAQNFLATCEQLLGVSVGRGRVCFQGRDVAVRSYPISIAPDELWDFASSEIVQEFDTQLDMGDTLNVVQVARTDPSKNLLRSLKAFELFLHRHPQFDGKVRYWGILPASRQGAEIYRHYLERIKAEAHAINKRFHRRSWKPVELLFDNSYARAIAAMKHYDVLLVNSLADGMNLVAKEGPIVNQRHGVLLLSETTGAFDELGDGALAINPYDVVGTAEALYQALTMPLMQRRRLQGILRRQIETHSIYRWGLSQMQDILEACPPRLRATPFFPELRDEA